MALWLIRGDSLDVLRLLPEACVDSVVTDPPAGINFMGRAWDCYRTEPHSPFAFVVAMQAIFEECLRALKPGGHALIWALPRTSHHTGVALEAAGFEIRDVVTHIFGSGFPKALNLSKAIDKEAGAARPIIGTDPEAGRRNKTTQRFDTTYANGTGYQGASDVPITGPATEDAARWEGWYTTLKPGSEHWIVARKPLEGTAVNNVLQYGVGAMNIDACRVASGPVTINRLKGWSGFGQELKPEYVAEQNTKGRYPANMILSHSEDCVCVGARRVPSNGQISVDSNAASQARQQQAVYGAIIGSRGDWQAYGSGDGTETIERWACVPGCPVRVVDEQAARGAASRYFYTAKASAKERHEGCEELFWRRVKDGVGFERVNRVEYEALPQKERGWGNIHPTVKSVALMRWLVRLVTPRGGLVLDPFAGSGTTALAAQEEGLGTIAIEREPAYIEIARARTRKVEAVELCCEQGVLCQREMPSGGAL